MQTDRVDLLVLRQEMFTSSREQYIEFNMNFLNLLLALLENIPCVTQFKKSVRIINLTTIYIETVSNNKATRNVSFNKYTLEAL